MSNDDEEITKNRNRKGIQSRYTFSIEKVMNHLNSNIFGQERALKAIEDMLKIVKAGLSFPDKPLYVALFLGPTGVGKTEVVRTLAEGIHGNRNYFCRVDMNTLAQDHYAASLAGAPPGYVGSKEGSTILDKLKVEGIFSKPGLILFDEVEKASGQVVQTLLNVFDSGSMTLATGDESIDFTNTIIIMTSNLGARQIQKTRENWFQYLLARCRHSLSPAKSSNDNEDSLLDKIVRKKVIEEFQPEFINRIDNIITFNWLEMESLLKIIDRHLDQINKRLEVFNCQIHIDDSAKKFLIDEGYDIRYGARALIRTIRKHIEVPLAAAMLEENYQDELPITYVGTRVGDRIMIKRG